MDDVYHRPALAHDLVLRLLDPPPVSAVRSGLFLAAPRRTGKSTFLKADLVPALEGAGARTLYIDLWEDLQRDPADVARWFERSGHRPEILAAALDAVVYEIGADRATLAARLERAIEEEVRASDEEQMRRVRTLTPLQAAVLRELASSGADFAPFTGASMARYAATIRSIDPNETLEPSGSNVQSALASLTRRGLVWSGERGLYALEDSRLAKLMRAEGMIG